MKKAATILIATMAMFMTGCSSISTEPDTVGLHYKGGSFSSKKFEGCVDSSTRQYDGPGDQHFQYPASQRIYDATGGKGAETDPFTVVSLDNAEMRVPVTINFTLITECETLRKFHEKLGNRYKAYMEDGDVTGGWTKMLNVVIGKPLDTTLDRIAQKYTWRQLWNNPSVKAEMEKEINSSISAMVEQQGGGEFFEGWKVLIQKPEPANQKLKDAIATEQTNVAGAQAAEAQAKADVAKAEAQIKVSQAEAAKKRAEILGYGSFENYLLWYMVSQGLNPKQPTYIVGGTKP